MNLATKYSNLEVVTMVTILSLLSISSVYSHPMDSYAIDQYLDIRIRDEGLGVAHRIEFAEIPTAAELPLVDKNHDFILDKEESAPYLEGLVNVLKEEIGLVVDGQALPLQYQNGEVFVETIPIPRLRAISTYRIPYPKGQGSPRRFELNLRHRSSARGDRQTRLVVEGSYRLESVMSSESVQPPGMAAPVITSATALVYGREVSWELVEASAPPMGSIPAFSRETQKTAPLGNPFTGLNPRGVDAELFEEDQAVTENERGPREIGDLKSQALPQADPEKSKGAESWSDQQFQQLISKPSHERGRSFIWIASLLAILYGVAHALEPGHGKTIVAAYLVGSHGKIHHAALLAIIVTFTHTFAVYILGLIALTNLEKVQGVYLPIIECVSWFCILLMGLMLFLKYYRLYVLGQLADPEFHSHGLGKGHTHDPHPHPHPHPHNHNHDHDHDHDDSDDHGHSHREDHAHPFAQPVEVRLWNLFTLGITGGIVPCPGALFVMMMALSSGQALVGLYLISLFSVGLALSLMAIGIFMVKTRRMMDNRSRNSRFVQFLPVLSSLIIFFFGIGFLFHALVKHGIVIIQI